MFANRNRYKTVAVYLTMILIIAQPLCGQSGTVIKTVPAPDYPYGITFDGANLWVGTSSTNGDQIWKIDPGDGLVLGSIPVPFVPPSGSYVVKGLSYDGTNLWVFMDLPSAHHPDKFYQVDPLNGTILKTLNSPENNYVGGMTYFDDHIWYTQYYANANNGRDVIIKMDTTGIPVDTIITLGEQPMGIAYNGEFIWCAEDTGFGATRQEIYEYHPQTGEFTGNLIRNPTASPRDMTYDGQYFWLVDYNNTNSLLYQFDTGGAGTPAITPSTGELHFGLTEIGQGKVFQMSITNSGTADLSVDTLIFTDGDFSSEATTFPLLIPAGDSETIGIIFTPSQFGSVTATMTIASNDPVAPAVPVSLTGKGMYPEPTIAFNATAHDFGNVWISQEGIANWELLIINQGIQDLEMMYFHPSDPVFSVAPPALPFLVLPDDTAIVTVRFEPQQAIGYSGGLTVGSNDPFNNNVLITLQGTGISGPYNAGFEFWHYQVPDHPGTSFDDFEVDGLTYMNDITGDGVSEIVLASENYWIICLNGAGSGGAEKLWSFNTYISNSSAGSIGGNFDFGVQDAISIASDLNSDGFNDVVIGTGGGNEHVYAIDGTNGEKIWEFGTDDPNSFGLGDFEAVDATTDFSGDGIPDVLAIADGNDQGTGYHRAYLFNGPDGNIIWSYFYPGPFLSFGKTIIAMEDVTGDSIPEAAIGVGNNGTADKKVYCLNGASGLPVWNWPTFAIDWNPKEIIALKLSGETPDLIVAEYFSKVYRVDGETGTTIWTHVIGGLSAVLQMDIITDINGDGIDDVLIASHSSAARCLSGDNGEVLWLFNMSSQNGIAALPDISGDGLEEVWVGTGTNIQAGAAYLISGSGDSLLFTQDFSNDPVNVVSIMPSIDGNPTFEVLAGTRDGRVICYSGGEPPTGVGALPAGPAETFQLGQNYPNPFNPGTVISYQLAAPAAVELSIYNVLGQKMKVLVQEKQPAGVYTVLWDGTDATGRKVASGTYFYQIKAGRFSETRKMLILK